jgi:hypothetical protein
VRGAEDCFIGIDRSTWIERHDWVGLLLAAVIVVHVGCTGAGNEADPLGASRAAGRPIVRRPRRVISSDAGHVSSMGRARQGDR